MFIEGLWGKSGRDGVGWRRKHGRLARAGGLAWDARSGLGNINRGGLASKSHSDAGGCLRSHDGWFEKEKKVVSLIKETKMKIWCVRMCVCVCESKVERRLHD